jgi:two-component system, cell cycle response regulator CtrA
MLILRVGQAALLGFSDPKFLREKGIRTEYAEFGHDALELMSLYDYDLILADLHLKDMLGYQMARRSLGSGLSTPTVILASQAAVSVIVKALDDGADDFVLLPCHPDELHARMRAVVRRTQGYGTSSLRFGVAELRLDNHELRINGETVSITPTEFGTLELLFMKRGTIVSKSDLLDHLYIGVAEPAMKTIDVIVCRLRKKLAAAGSSDMIETVWGFGYILHDLIGATHSLVHGNA